MLAYLHHTYRLGGGDEEELNLSTPYSGGVALGFPPKGGQSRSWLVKK